MEIFVTIDSFPKELLRSKGEKDYTLTTFIEIPDDLFQKEVLISGTTTRHDTFTMMLFSSSCS